MDVLVIGSFGRCGTALIDHLQHHETYNFTYLDRYPPTNDIPVDDNNFVKADISNFNRVSETVKRHDAVILLAAYPYVDGEWDDVFEPNIIGVYNVLEAVRKNKVNKFVFASSNHAVGQYEIEHSPELYTEEYDLTLDADTPTRPDSYYGVTKTFGENLTSYYTETYEYPKQAYSIRIGATNYSSEDHPYASAERGVENGDFVRGSREYEKLVARLKAIWLSRQDFSHLIDCCLQDGDVEYGIFYGVSNNDTRWFDISDAKKKLDYQPQDNGCDWDSPPK